MPATVIPAYNAQSRYVELTAQGAMRIPIFVPGDMVWITNITWHGHVQAWFADVYTACTNGYCIARLIHVTTAFREL